MSTTQLKPLFLPSNLDGKSAIELSKYIPSISSNSQLYGCAKPMVIAALLLRVATGRDYADEERTFENVYRLLCRSDLASAFQESPAYDLGYSQEALTLWNQAGASVGDDLRTNICADVWSAFPVGNAVVLNGIDTPCYFEAGLGSQNHIPTNAQLYTLDQFLETASNTLLEDHIWSHAAASLKAPGIRSAKNMFDIVGLYVPRNSGRHMVHIICKFVGAKAPVFLGF